VANVISPLAIMYLIFTKAKRVFALVHGPSLIDDKRKKLMAHRLEVARIVGGHQSLGAAFLGSFGGLIVGTC